MNLLLWLERSLMQPVQIRLSWLMAATAGVAVVLSQLRRTNGPGEALAFLLIFILPIPLFGLVLAKLVVPFLRRVRSVPSDQESRRSRLFSFGSNLADWVIVTSLALFLFCFCYGLIVALIVTALTGFRGDVLSD